MEYSIHYLNYPPGGSGQDALLFWKDEQAKALDFIYAESTQQTANYVSLLKLQILNTSALINFIDHLQESVHELDQPRVLQALVEYPYCDGGDIKDQLIRIKEHKESCQ